jgi:GNAT superfamily N-acetyltransferase
VRVRLATNQDKDYVLNFCKNTFSWGDYIDRVWNIWISEPNGILLVAEENENYIEKKPIAIIHGIIIPEKTIWIEGIRVDPEYRKQKLATNLINSIIEFGKENGAINSAAIVSVKNEASKRLMEKSGYKVLSKWSYISTNHMIFLPTIYNLHDNCKIADINDYQQIINFFLRNSKIFEQSGRKFVKSWRWHDLTDDRLHTMIRNKQVIIIVEKVDDDDDGNKNNQHYNKDEIQVKGIAIIDIEGYWNNQQNTFQFAYIDTDSEKLLRSLINKSIELTLNYHEKNKYNNDENKNKFEKFQLFGPYKEYYSKIFNKSDITFSEQFLLYHKKI